MSQHKAKFTWGTGPNAVFVAGNFNNWSDSATPLSKLADGCFAADVDLPWGEKQAFKYVVDGEWKIREDEAKEWDAAGNMNNVYTAPHAPEHDSAATSTTSPSTATTVPSSKTPDTAAPATDSTTTKPETLLASTAPAAAAGGAAGVAAGTLGAPLGGPAITTTTNSRSPAVTTTEKSTATAAVPVEAAPAKSEPTPAKIEKTAANANVGAAPATTDDNEKSVVEKAAEYGAGAVAALGAAVGGAVVAAEKAVGVDLTHSSPTEQMSIEEAKAKGIDVNSLPKKDAATDATSPVGTKPPVDGVAALEEKTKALKVDTPASAKGVSAVPLPKGEPPKTSTAVVPEPVSNVESKKYDIPAQGTSTEDHKTVPAPTITPVSARDPAKDRTADAATKDINSDTAGTKPIDSSPAVDAKAAKTEAEKNPAGTGSTPAAAKGSAAAATTATPTAASAAPATPAKTTTTAATGTPANGTAVSTTSTPSKATPSAADETRKRKSSFFTKVKHAFSPNKKEEKK